MNTSRRFFLRGLGVTGATSLLGGCRVWTCPTGAASTGDAKLKFGVLSDVHLRVPVEDVFNHHVDDFYIRRALEWYRDQGVDAVLIAGDIADHGLCSQLESLAKAWNDIFPDNCAPDGRHVEKLFIMGNHDCCNGARIASFKKKYPDPEELKRAVISADHEGNWERIFDEPFKPVYVKTVKGYTFIGAHWMNIEKDGKQLFEVADPTEVIAKVAPTVDPAKPFFYFQHPQPAGTCYGECWGQDNGAVTKALSAYPNAVAFSGHSHYSLTDERTIWQGAFTSINTSSLSFSGFPPVVDGNEYGYENVRGSSRNHEQEKVASECPFQYIAKQGMLVEVYEDRMVLVRREFRWEGSLGDDWVIPLRFDGSNPASEANRKKKERPPRYPKGAKVKVNSFECANRKGEKVPCFDVIVPQANVEKATRPFQYELRIVLEDGTVFGTRKLLTPGYNMPAETVDCYCPVSIPIAKSQLPQDKSFRFEVVPMSSLGTRGEALASELLHLNK